MIALPRLPDMIPTEHIYVMIERVTCSILAPNTATELVDTLKTVKEQAVCKTVGGSLLV